MTGPVATELDGGSYLAHYGILNPWTQWLIRTAPELAGMRPSVLRTEDVRPRCPDIFCRRPMNPRPEGWACYHHEVPTRRKPRLDVPEIRWAPGQPSALSLVGKETEIVWRHFPDRPQDDGYIIIAKEDAYVDRNAHLAVVKPGDDSRRDPAQHDRTG